MGNISSTHLNNCLVEKELLFQKIDLFNQAENPLRICYSTQKSDIRIVVELLNIF